MQLDGRADRAATVIVVVVVAEHSGPVGQQHFPIVRISPATAARATAERVDASLEFVCPGRFSGSSALPARYAPGW
ncbi:MAG: hypothetical protein WCB92_07630, partial [Mycobacterium sp.]